MKLREVFKSTLQVNLKSLFTINMKKPKMIMLKQSLIIEDQDFKGFYNTSSFFKVILLLIP